MSDTAAASPRAAHRHAFRVALFQRRWRGAREAYALADVLEQRDASRDTRRMCIECKHHPYREHSAWCRRRQAVIPPGILQTCSLFDWEKP